MDNSKLIGDPLREELFLAPQALRHQPQPRSIAPLQRWRGHHEEERRRKAGGPSRIRRMGERSPKRRQEDGRVRVLRILRERKARPSRFPCRRQQMANRSWLASSRRSIERLRPPRHRDDAFSFRLRCVIQPIYFICRVQRAAKHLNSRLMPIFVRKCAPSDHCLLQGGAFD